MALIKCPECKKKISDQCGKCPNCGYPIEVTETPIEILDNEVIENEPIIEEKIDISKKERKPINKKMLIGIISVAVALILIVTFTLLGLTHFNETWKDATYNFKVVSNKLERMNDELDSLIQKSENLVETKDTALDEEKRAVLKGAILDAKKGKKEISKKPLLAKDIELATSTMEEIDYTEIVKSLEEAYKNFEKSIKQYKLVDNPTEEYLLSRLKTVKGIFNITAYTEETDVDKHLNKAKWYYSKIAFQHEDITDSAIEYGYSITEVGNPAGGCVEAFKTVEDAERRNQEMQSYEGTVRSPGTHKVIGTVLVRTSEDLTTAKQKELEQAIIDALTYIEEDESKKEPVIEDKPADTKPVENTQTPQNTTNSIVDATPQKLSFEGGICSNINAWGDGMPLDNINRFANGQDARIAGRVVGFSGKKSITLLWTLPDGTTDSVRIDNLTSGETFNFGQSECGIGTGTVSVIFAETGESLGTFSFEFY